MNIKISIYAFFTSILSTFVFRHLFKKSLETKEFFHRYDVLLIFSFLVLGYFVFYTIISKLIYFKGKTKIYNVLFILSALIMLIFPLTKVDDNKISVAENRTLQKFPQLLTNETFNYSYGNQFEAWLNDHFRGRSKVIKINNKLERLLNGKIKDVKAFEGKNSWLFYASENSIGNFQNRNNFDEEKLQALQHRLEEKRDFCKSLGASYYILIAPDKNKVYGEFYPEHYRKGKIGNIGKGEQVCTYITKNSDIKITYPLQELMIAKENNEVYFKNDTHWNGVGAFVGYQNLMSLIAADYEDLKILQWSDFNIRKYENSGDLQKMLMLKDRIYISETLDFKNQVTFKKQDLTGKNDNVSNKKINYISTSNKFAKYKVVVFRDSFSTALLPYLSQQFKQVEYLWTRDFEKNKAFIEEIKPDIVIEEVVERGTSSLFH